MALPLFRQEEKMSVNDEIRYVVSDVTMDVVNTLVADMLNPGKPYFPSEDNAQAMDMLGERMKIGLAGVTLALLEVARAIAISADKVGELE